MSVGLTGTVTERLREVVSYMHRKRRRMTAIRRSVHRREEAQVRLRYRNAEMRDPTPEELEVLLDRVVSQNNDFNTAVGDEVWATRLVTAYALLRIAEQNDEIIALLSRQNRILDEMTVAPESG